MCTGTRERVYVRSGTKIQIPMHTHTHTIHAYVHTDVCVGVCESECMCVRACVCECVCVHLFVCASVCALLCMYNIHTHVIFCACVHVYNMRPNTYTHTHTRAFDTIRRVCRYSRSRNKRKCSERKGHISSFLP